MKIYTKTGDQGMTGLFGGPRRLKSDLRIDAYGTVDELNAYIGLVRDLKANQNRTKILTEIQDRLFTIGALLAANPDKQNIKVPQLAMEDVEMLEKEIDKMENELEPMKSFVLPGGHLSVSHCHVARTVCRRAERTVVSLSEKEDVADLVVIYLNRLSDYLFVLSRKISKELGASETPWKPKM